MRAPNSFRCNLLQTEPQARKQNLKHKLCYLQHDSVFVPISSFTQIFKNGGNFLIKHQNMNNLEKYS